MQRILFEWKMLFLNLMVITSLFNDLYYSFGINTCPGNIKIVCKITKTSWYKPNFQCIIFDFYCFLDKDCIWNDIIIVKS